MTRQEYVTAQVEKLVAEGMERDVAEVVAETTWNLIKWQYEDE